jgi:hypothetical protein
VRVLSKPRSRKPPLDCLRVLVWCVLVPLPWIVLAVCIEHRLPAYELRRTWTIQDGEPSGPIWELAFAQKA